MSAGRPKSFWWFQIIFWSVAGMALFISGLSQTNFMAALVRNLFLFFAGFLTSFFFAMLIDSLRDAEELRLRLITFSLVYVVALLCVVTINFISFSMQGIAHQDLSWGMWFSGTMNFALVYWFWSELFIQKVYLKGQNAVSPGDQKNAGQDYLVIAGKGEKLRLPVAKITAILAAGDYVEIDAGDEVHLDRRTIQSLEDRLVPAGFLRVHRSAIVNPGQVMRVSSLNKGRFLLTMNNGRQVTSSRSFQIQVRENFL